jgi:hypothetical protein
MINLDFLKILRKRRLSSMKTLKILLIVGFFTLVALECSFAQTTARIDVDADVPGSLELTYWIREAPGGVDPYGSGSSDASAILFDNLTWDNTNRVWVADNYYTVFMIATTGGQSYEILQTCLGLENAAGDDLNNSFTVDPDYQSADEWAPGVPQGSMPAADALGTASVAVVADKLVYDGNSGESRIVRAYYGLATGEAGTPGDPITGDQPSGLYSGEVVVTLVQR